MSLLENTMSNKKTDHIHSPDIAIIVLVKANRDGLNQRKLAPETCLCLMVLIYKIHHQ